VDGGGNPACPLSVIPWVVVRILGMIRITEDPNSCYGRQISLWRRSMGAWDSPYDLSDRILSSNN